MAVINSIAHDFEEMAGWRQHLHQNPEIGFDCYNTANTKVRSLEPIIPISHTD